MSASLRPIAKDISTLKASNICARLLLAFSERVYLFCQPSDSHWALMSVAVGDNRMKTSFEPTLDYFSLFDGTGAGVPLVGTFAAIALPSAVVHG